MARIMESKYEAIKQLLVRNKQTQAVDPSQKIQFPFLVVPTQRSNILDQSVINNKQVCLNFRNKIKTIVDTDALLVLYWEGCLINNNQPPSDQ